MTNFRAKLSSTKLDEMYVYFKKINKDIGIGAFAKRALKPGMLLANLRGNHKVETLECLLLQTARMIIRWYRQQRKKLQK